MSSNQQEPRPPKRRTRIDVPVDPYTLDGARKKAGSLRALRAVIRAFLDLWSSGEYPDIPKEEIDRQLRRAKKVPRGKKQE